MSISAVAQGNGRDASMSGTLDGNVPAAGTNRYLFPGMGLQAVLGTPGGTLMGQPYFIAGELVIPGSHSPLQLPNEPGVVALSANLVPLVDTINGTTGGAYPATLPDVGATVGLQLSAFYPGTTLLVQGAVIDPGSLNGLAISGVTGGRLSLPPTLAPIFGGTSVLGQFGYATHVADLDQDGSDELVLGAREENTLSFLDAGRVFIYGGKPPALIQTIDDPNPEAFSHFGVSVSTGDVNGDGFQDIAVGARQTDVVGLQDAGRTIVYFGPQYTQSQTLLPPVPEFRGQFGHRTACGDFDGDGYCDLAVSSIGATSLGVIQAGVIDVYFGPGLTYGYRIEDPVPTAGARFGYRLNTPDLDNDGFADLVVGTPFHTLTPAGTDDSGAVFVLKGPFLTLDTYFPNPFPSVSGLLGADVACRDLDGDGSLEILAGAELDDSGGLAGQGSLWILEGPTYATSSQWFSPAPVSDGGFGAGVDAGDFDGDGFVDLFVGEFFHTGGAFRSGRVQVLLGPDYLQSITVLEPTTGSNFQFGRRVRAADLDGDNIVEMIVGVPNSSASGVARAGAVYAVSF